MKSESATRKKSGGRKAAKKSARGAESRKKKPAGSAKGSAKKGSSKKTTAKKASSKKAPEKASSRGAAKKGAAPSKTTPRGAAQGSSEPRSAAKRPARKPAGDADRARATKKAASKKSTAASAKGSGGGGASPRSRRAEDRRSRALAKEKALAAQHLPSRVEFSKPPVPHRVEPGLTAEKYRNALRGPLRESGLPRRIAHGAILPVLLAGGRSEQLRDQLDWALEDRVPAYYLAESLLQSYLFVGFPRTINALAALHEVTRSRRRGLGLAADPLHVPSEIPSLDRILGGPGDFGSALKGRRIRLAEGPPMHLESPGEGPGSFERYAREWWRRGMELCRAVYGTQYPRLRENLGRIHPELADWMVFEGYGKVLSRPVITPRERELWIIPLLLAQDVPEQLYSHLRGARNLDVPIGRIRAVLWLASAITGPAALATASELLAELESRDERRDDRFRPVY